MFGKDINNSKEHDKKLENFIKSEEYLKLLQDMIDNHVEVGTNLDKFIKTNSKGMKNQTLDFTSTIIRKYKDPNSNLTNITSLEVAQNLSIYNCKEDLKLI